MAPRYAWPVSVLDAGGHGSGFVQCAAQVSRATATQGGRDVNTPTNVGGAAGTRRRRALVAALGVSTALALGLAFWRGSPGTSAPREKLVIAVSTTPHAALLHLAQAKGFFAQEGLDLTLKPVTHGKAALDLLAQGQVDLAAAAEVPFVIAVLNGQPLGIAATVLSVSSEMTVVARRDRGVAQPADLLRKRVGVTFGTSGDYFLWAFLAYHRLAPDRVEMVDVPPLQIAERLAAGAVDAIATWEPLRTRAREALGAQGVSFNEANAYTVTHVVVGRNDFMRQRVSSIEKLIRGLLKAEHFVRTQPQQALALTADLLKLEAADLSPGWQALEFRVDLRQSQLITLEDQARWAMARGYAKPQAVPNFLEHIYLGALLAVSPERVTVVH